MIYLTASWSDKNPSLQVKSESSKGLAMENFITSEKAHVSTGNVSRSEGPPQDEWDAHRQTISALYEGEKLATVREIMRRDYDFEASERMYKTRVRHWGLDKKAKPDEMSHALRIIEKRKVEGKKTHLFIRGREMDELRVQKYFRRQKITRVRPARIRQDPQTPVTITYFTPPASPLPDAPPKPTEFMTLKLLRHSHASPTIIHNSVQAQSATNDFSEVRRRSQFDILRFMSLSPNDILTLPNLHDFRYYEHVLTEIRAYYNSYFHSSLWQIWLDDKLGYKDASVSSPMEYLWDNGFQSVHNHIEDPGRLIGNFDIATRLYGTDSAEESNFLLDAAFEKLAPLFRQQHPQLLSCLLLLICQLDAAGLVDLIEVFLDHAYEMALLILKASHPITRFTSWLSHRTNRAALYDGAFECIEDQYRQHVGPLHLQYLEVTYNRAWSCFHRHEYLNAQSGLEKLLRLYESYGRGTGFRARKVLYSMAQVQIVDGSLDSADRLLAETLRRITHRYGIETRTEIGYECLRLRATLRCHQSNGLDTFPAMCSPLQDAEAMLGNNHPTAILLRRFPVFDFCQSSNFDLLAQD